MKEKPTLLEFALFWPAYVFDTYGRNLLIDGYRLPQCFYKSYIQSKYWKAQSDEAKKRALYRCQLCNKSANNITLHTHHRTYERLGFELDEDLTVLCAGCHSRFHGGQ